MVGLVISSCYRRYSVTLVGWGVYAMVRWEVRYSIWSGFGICGKVLGSYLFAGRVVDDFVIL